MKESNLPWLRYESHRHSSPLAQILLGIRQRQKLTEGQLAIRLRANRDEVGVDVQSVARWEKGKVVPQWPKLQAYLHAIGASAGEIALCQGLVPSRQAALQRSGESLITKGNDEDALPAVPGSGDLLRAMRMRAGLTTTDLARRLGKRVSVISKWESADGFPNQEMLEILAVAVGAYDEEIAYLQTKSRSVIPIHLWSASPKSTIDRCADSLGECEWLSATCTDFPGDLAFLAIESTLAPFARSGNQVADRLLMRTYIAHAEWMNRRNRPETIGRYARHVLNRMPTFVTGPEGIPLQEPWWSRAATMLATCCMQSYMKDMLPKHRNYSQCRDEVEQIYQNGWQLVVSELQRWKPSFASPYHRSCIDRSIAGYLKMLWGSDEKENFTIMRHCYEEALRDVEANPCVLTGNQLLSCRVSLLNLLNNYRWEEDVENLVEEKQCLEFGSEHGANDLSMYTWFVFYKAEAFLIHGRKAEGLETERHLQDICEEYGLEYLLPAWTHRLALLA